jgi:two-component system chemotaxis sensor kinase CheA
MTAGLLDELLTDFLIEGRDLVQQVGAGLLAIERDGNGPETAGRIDGVFRAVHTLKGSCGLFGFGPMGRMLHAAEDLLGALRDGRVGLSGASLGPLLDCAGLSERWLDVISRTGALPAAAAGEADVVCAALAAAGGHGVAAAAAPVEESAVPDWLPALLGRHGAALVGLGGDGGTAFRYVPAADCFLLGDDPLALARRLPRLVALEVVPRAPWPATLDPFVCHLVIAGISAAPAAELKPVFRFVPDQVALAPVRGVPPASSAAGADESARFLRVDAGRIDALADIAGELIVARNSLAHAAAQIGAGDAALARRLAESSAEIDRLAAGMHRAVMQVRLTGLARLFQRLALLLRDIAASLGKTVRFTMEGEEIELDRSIVDGLFEPLLHILRNAVDHGIEDAETRVATGKHAGGHVHLAASREASRIVVSVRDDGRGIAGARRRPAAVARGLLPDGAARAMSVEDIIFTPGFSTAASVTDVSGRGVGMDAVRAAVQALGGTVSVASKAGEGTAVRLSLPQSVLVSAIITVWAGGERFGVPIEAVTETMRIARGAIQTLHGGEAFVLRGRTVPLLRLASLLKLDGVGAPPSPMEKVLIVQRDGGPVGLIVDAVGERMEVLLRAVPALLSGLACVRFTALTGDGGVLLILDIAALLA